MTLETIVDNLRDGYAQLQPGTMLHADQLMAEQVTDASLRAQWFYVADGSLYSLEGKNRTPTLWLTRESHNLVLRHLSDKVNSSYDQLIKTGTDKDNFHPSSDEARKAMQAKDTLCINLTKLGLHGNEAEWRYVEISTTNYKALNAEERKLAERWYGRGKAFGTAMKTLKDAGISTTRVYVLSPEYVNREAKESPIVRAARRFNFYYDAGSNADGRRVDNHYGVRGVRRIVAPQGRAPEKGQVPGAPVAAQEIKLATFDEVRAYSARFVPDVAREPFEAGLRKLYKP